MSLWRSIADKASAAASGAAQLTGLSQQLLTHAISWASGVLVGALLVALIAVSCSKAQAAGVDKPRIPVIPTAWRLTLERQAALHWGLQAPTSLLAAQVHQESRWNAKARSPYAEGLTQFTPPTADWIAQAYPAVGPPDPWDPHWALRAQAQYMAHLHRRNPGATACDTWAFALASYNGGETWLRRDRRLASALGADPARWFDQVERESRRARWAWIENRGYVARILKLLEPAYAAAGWAGALGCGR